MGRIAELKTSGAATPLVSSYGVTTQEGQRERVRPLRGLVGQAALERKPGILITQASRKDYEITIGFGPPVICRRLNIRRPRPRPVRGPGGWR